MAEKTYLTPEKKKFLENNFNKLSYVQLGLKVNMSHWWVWKYGNKNGLKKTLPPQRSRLKDRIATALEDYNLNPNCSIKIIAKRNGTSETILSKWITEHLFATVPGATTVVITLKSKV